MPAQGKAQAPDFLPKVVENDTALAESYVVDDRSFVRFG